MKSPALPGSYSVTAKDALDPEPDVSCSPTGALVPLGTTTITCTVTDWAGNTAAAGFSVTVQNTLPPAAVLGFSARGGDERYVWPGSARGTSTIARS